MCYVIFHLESYVDNYCALFPAQCSFVTSYQYCPPENCVVDYGCGFYTGPVNFDFQPHGVGSFIQGRGSIREVYWSNGCPSGIGCPKVIRLFQGH